MPDSTPTHRSCRVVLSGGRVDVLGGHVVSIRHCTEWHRVERCMMQSSQPVAVQDLRKA